MLGQIQKNNKNNKAINWGKNVLFHPSRNYIKLRIPSVGRWGCKRKGETTSHSGLWKLMWEEVANLSKKPTKYLMNRVNKTVFIFTVLIASCLLLFCLPLLHKYSHSQTQLYFYHTLKQLVSVFTTACLTFGQPLKHNFSS